MIHIGGVIVSCLRGFLKPPSCGRIVYFIVMIGFVISCSGFCYQVSLNLSEAIVFHREDHDANIGRRSTRLTVA